MNQETILALRSGLVYSPGPPESYTMPGMSIELTQPDTTLVPSGAAGSGPLVPMQTLAHWTTNGEVIDPMLLYLARLRYKAV